MTLTTEELAERKKGIGGSDVAGICLLSRTGDPSGIQKTPLDVYRSKVEEDDDKPDDELASWLEWGHRHEPAIRQKVHELTGLDVLGPERAVGPEPWMMGNLDGRVGDAVLEIKTSRYAHGWGETGTDEVPDAYLAQVAWYMLCTGLRHAYIAALIAGSDFRLYHVEPTPALLDGLASACGAFWREHVVPRIPPPPVTLADCKSRWPEALKGKAYQADTSLASHLATLEDMRAQKAECEKAIDGIEARIRRLAGDAETILGPDGTPWATLKTSKRKGYVVEDTQYRSLKLTKEWKQR